MTTHSCKLAQDLGKERNLLLVLPRLKILTHQAIEEGGVEEGENASQNSLI